MSIKARIERLEAAPPRDNSLRDRIEAARVRLGRPERRALNDEEKKQIKGKALAEQLKFFRMGHLKEKKAAQLAAATGQDGTGDAA